MEILMTGCIHNDPRRDDGLRVSIMNRHTLSDGRTRDMTIVEGRNFHQHWPELGPPSKLIGAYYRGEVTWGEFAMLYREHLFTNEDAKWRIAQAIVCARRSRITLLCCEETPEFCHRRLVAEWIGKLVVDLTIVIN